MAEEALRPGWRGPLDDSNQDNAIRSGDLAGYDLRKCGVLRRFDLSEADLSRCNLAGVDLSGVRMNQALLVGADLGRCRLSQASVWSLS